VRAARANALAYETAFAGLPGVRVAPLRPDDHAWLFTLLVADPERFLASLAEDGVEASRVHARNDGHPALGAAPAPLPGVDAFASRELAIPVGGWVGPEDRARVIRAVTRAAGGG
ncbi:MAG: hypothetical protein FJ104_17675, partial [Deltaproteobacteria bacterium]|nr:hypothetical protein [Deltaproteobacteria bacterium]